jgi:hypothetical protein
LTNGITMNNRCFVRIFRRTFCIIFYDNILPCSDSSSTGSSTESTGCSDVWLSGCIVNGTLVPGCFIDTDHDG